MGTRCRYLQEEAAGPFKPELNPRSLMLAEAAAARKLEGGFDDRKDTQTQQHSPGMFMNQGT